MLTHLLESHLYQVQFIMNEFVHTSQYWDTSETTFELNSSHACHMTCAGMHAAALQAQVWINESGTQGAGIPISMIVQRWQIMI